MNVISKSILYYKLTHPGPAMARLNENIGTDMVLVDWDFVDEKCSYNIKSYKHHAFYVTDVKIGNYLVTRFMRRRAKKLFNLSQSATLRQNAIIITTVYPETRQR